MNNYVMQRGWMDHPALFYKEPFTHREAWCWLIEKALWKELPVKVNGPVLLLKRGQLSYSIRYMAKGWEWTNSKVERFLSRLKSEAMIETSAETGQLVITICNYNKFQLSPKYDKAQTEARGEEEPIRRRGKTDTNNKTGLIPANTGNSSCPKKNSEIVSQLSAAGICPQSIVNGFKGAVFDLENERIYLPTVFQKDYVYQRLESRLRRAFGFYPELIVSMPDTDKAKFD
jgi:hypothetical protein